MMKIDEYDDNDDEDKWIIYGRFVWSNDDG